MYEEEVKQLYAEDYFKNGEQVYIHIAANEFGGVMHCHDFIEIVYIISGSARHFMGDINYEVRKGDLVIVNYGVPHTFIPLDDDEPFKTYDLLFTTDFFDVSGMRSKDFSALASSYLFCSLFANDTIGENGLNLIRSETENLSSIFSKIYEEYTNRQKGFMNIIRAYLVELITKIFREVDRKAHSHGTREQREVVEKAIDYMKHNFNTRINLDSIVKDLFLSKNYFRQLFKSTTGMSVTDFIQNTRINEAIRLLETTNRTIYDIAGDCGFGDVKFFYKTFKKITGKTPNEYRKIKGDE